MLFGALYEMHEWMSLSTHEMIRSFQLGSSHQWVSTKSAYWSAHDEIKPYAVARWIPADNEKADYPVESEFNGEQ